MRACVSARKCAVALLSEVTIAVVSPTATLSGATAAVGRKCNRSIDRSHVVTVCRHAGRSVTVEMGLPLAQQRLRIDEQILESKAEAAKYSLAEGVPLEHS